MKIADHIWSATEELPVTGELSAALEADDPSWISGRESSGPEFSNRRPGLAPFKNKVERYRGMVSVTASHLM
jgi:hypothetical protein